MAERFPFETPNACLDEVYAADDGWLVFSEPNSSALATRIPHGRRAICVNEPAVMNALPVSYLNQFGLLISPFRMAGFRGAWFQSHTGLPWFFGATMEGKSLTPVLSRQQLLDLKPPEKSNTVSVVLSKKVFHEGHRKRLRLLELLKDQLGDRLLIYGRGIRDIQDKAEAIMPSALHLALENSVEPSYWSEKLADAFLGYALPVYGGCPDIHKWFSEDSLLIIDPDKAEQACSTICEALDKRIYHQRLPAICEARNRILLQESAFNVIVRAIEANSCDAAILSRSDIIQPPRRASLSERVRREVRRIFYQLTFRSRLGS